MGSEMCIRDRGNTLFELGHSNFLQDISMKAKETKAKNELLGLNQDKKLLRRKKKKSSKLKTTYRKGEDICK